LQFFFTPFGIAGVGAIGGLLVLIFLINYLVALVKDVIKHSQAKTLLLTSSFPQMKDEIIKLLQKPAYDVTVAFITTAAKPEENLDYLKNDWSIMKDEMGFNLEEIDIEGKKEGEVMKLLELKDIIFVEGGNTFYLLKAMRGCNFEKVIRKLLKSGKVYIGVSAGSIVAGRTVKTAGWKHDKNFVDLKDLRGLNLVPFDIFVHYQPEHAEIIKQKIKNPKKRAKKLRILADGQALLVQGREVDLIGDGEAVII
jgi:dipeptidase E